jgi:hypothetical protein
LEHLPHSAGCDETLYLEDALEDLSVSQNSGNVSIGG